MLTDPTDIDAAIGRALGPKKRASAPKGLTAPPAPKPFDDNQPVGDKIREEYRQRRDVDPVVRRKMRAQQDAVEGGLTEVAAELGGKRAAARLNVLEESETPTSSPARITELSRKYGVPSEVVRVDPKLWEARDRRERSVEAFGNSPKLEAWTAEERVRAALITDDLDALVGVENALSPQKRADIQRRVAEREEYRIVTADPKKALEGASPLSTLFSYLGADTLSVEQEDSSFMGGLRSIGGGAVNTVDIMWNGLAAQLADATYGLTGWEAARADSERLTQANQRLGMVQQLRRPDYGYAGGMVYDGFNSLALMAPGMAASIYSGNATPALTSAFLLTQPEAYTKYRARGASGGEAFLGSMLEGGIEVAMEKMPMGVLVDNVGKSATRQWIGEYLVKEGVTEQLTTLGQDAVDTAIANPNKTWGDYFAERPEAALRTAVATLVASGSIGTINTTVNTLAGRMERDMRNAQAGERTAEFVAQLKGIAEASKMREADVSSFENWVKTAAEGSGATDVYIEAAKLVEVLEQSGMTSEQITEALPSLATTLGPAAVSGGDVRIPIEELVARGGELSDALAPHLRINPEEMSQEQAKVYMQGAEEALKEQAAQIMGEAVVDEAFRVSVDTVREGVLSQLNTANRFTPDVNTAYASLHANFFARLALDLGITPEEVAARYPLAVESGEVAGDRVLEQQPRFAPETVSNLLAFDDWAVMTAENPNAEPLTDAQNARRNAQLREDLDALGVEYTEAKGSYGRRENSFAITGITESDALQLAQKYGQESVLTRKGLVYRDGSVSPAKGVKQFKRRPKDFYTEVNGALFSVDIDFATRIAPQSYTTLNQLAVEPTLADAIARIRANSEPSAVVRARDGTLLFVADPRDAGPVEREVKSAGLDAEVVAPTDARVNDATAVWLKEPPVDADGYITLQHFSSTDDLAVLDPTRWGMSGGFLPASERATIGTAPPRTYFGIATGQPGGYINEFGEGAARYEARIPAEGLYDARRDPDGLKVDGKFSEKAVAEAGYAGYWTQNNQLGLVAVVFHPTEVKQVGRRGAFGRWFKDSKVVDESGAPLVVYHGTNSEFDAFDPDAVGSAYGIDEQGFYFTSSEEEAQRWADGAPNARNPKVLGVYLAIEKPWVIDAPEGRSPVDYFESGEGVFARGGQQGAVAYGISSGYDGMIIRGEGEQLYVAFRPDQIKSATGNSGAFDPNTASIYNQDAPVFYSALARAITTSKQAKAPAAQWKGILQNAPGVKAEELEWSGLLDALDFDPARVLTREELAEVVDKGGIKVDEVVLGEAREPTEAEINERALWRIDNGLSDETNSIDDAVRELEEENLPITQFASWSSDPENGTYRELLMTLPIGQGGNPDRAPSTHWDQPNVVAHVRFMEKRDAEGERVLFVEEVQSDWHQKGRDQGYETGVDPAVVEAAEARYFASVEAARAARNAAARFGYPLMVEANQYTIDAYEKLGEDSGFRTMDVAVAAARKAKFAEREIEMWYPEVAQFAGTASGPQGVELRAMLEAYTDRASEMRLAGRELDVAKGLITNGGVPRAPFQTSWPALVMKRAIRWAVDNGYRKVAWTTGEQQAERYDLSSAVGEIQTAPAGVTVDEGHYLIFKESAVQAVEAAGQGTAVGDYYGGGQGIIMSDAQVLEVFGQDLGGRILAAGPNHVFTDTDLRVGGEGMKAFYDRNLVNITNGLVKKYGTKVGPVRMTASEAENIQQRIADLEYRVANGPGPETAMGEGNQRQLDLAREQLALADASAETQPGFEITPELAAAATHGFPLFQRTGAPRGQIAFGSDITQSPTTITLLRGADLSTFLHETGHFFLEVMVDVAARPGAPARIEQDLKAFFKWSGVKNLDQWRQMTPDEKREHHERFARGFEAYLFEGALPSIELAPLFQRFKTWLQSVYRSIAQLDVELTPEVRGVFDRMFAAEAQIKEAQALQGMEPMFTEKPVGMTDGEWDAYQRAHLDATREAKDELERRSLRDMRYASNMQGRELKRLQREVKTMRADLREEATAAVAERPEQQATRLFRAGETPEGQTVEGPVKISIAALETAFEGNPEGLAAAKKKLGFGKNGVLAKEGMSLEDAAMLTGYTSGDHLLQELLIAEPFKQAVETELDILMSERYGDLTSPEALRAAVDKAIHNRVRGRFVATELAALDKAPGKAQALAKAAKAYALSAIGRTKIRDLRPAQYEAAERRSAKAALEAHRKDDIARAAAEKRNQLVNYHAARAAREAEADVQKILRYFKRFDTDSTRKNLDPEYRDQIDQMLERFDLRKSVSNKEADRRKSLLEWVERQRERGFEPLIPEELLTTAGRTPYRELTADQFSGVYDAVRNIEHLARLKKKLLTAKKDREFADAVDDIANSVESNAFKITKEIVGTKNWIERVQSGVKDFFAFHRKFANLAHVMDGNQYGGAVWEFFVRNMNDRGDWQAAQNERATVSLSALFDRLNGQDTAKRVYIPEIKNSLSLEDRLVVALNLGNEGNTQRMMDGDKWEQPQLNAVLEPLTREHWEFVQATWDYIDTYWPMIRDKQLRVDGVAPEKVEAQAFTRRLADGTDIEMRGGYFPVKYNPDRSTRAKADNLAEELKQKMQGGYTAATTRRGHIKARSEEVNRPVRKDFGVVFEHVNQVIHDLAWHEYLIDANRLLRASAVDGAIRQHYGPEVLHWMSKAVEDIAVGDLAAQNVIEAGFNYLRTGVSIAGLGWNLWTSLLQPIGLTQSAARIGTKWVARGASRILGGAAKLENAATFVYGRSEFMRLRAKTMQREINEIRNRVGAKSPLRRGADKLLTPGVNDAIQGSYFVLIAKAQLIADLPTWIGMYEKQLEAGQTEERAADLADQAVLDSQGGGQIKDLAGVQRGGVMLKIWTSFYGYFSTTFNLLVDRTSQLRRVGAADLPYYAVDVFLLTALPSFITTLMYELLKGGADDEPEELAAKAAGDLGGYMLGLVVGARELSALLTGNAGYNGTAGTRFFAEANKLGKQVSQGEADEALFRAANSVAGIVLHYPSGQLDRAVRGTQSLAEGEGNILSPFVGPPVE